MIASERVDGGGRDRACFEGAWGKEITVNGINERCNYIVSGSPSKGSGALVMHIAK
jgi:hypothetical protein